MCSSVNLAAVADEDVQNIRLAMPDEAVVQPRRSRKMLLFSLFNGYEHSCIPYWQQAMEIMGNKTGAFDVVHGRLFYCSPGHVYSVTWNKAVLEHYLEGFNMRWAI